MSGYLVGIDIGGTFTDCAVVAADGTVITAKAASTPPDFSQGVVAVLGAAAQRLGLSVEDFCARIRLISHGTTTGTNTLIQRRGAKVGLLTTRGHEDVIHIMRGSRGYSGRDIRKVVHFPEGAKPQPIVPKRLIEGVPERIDSLGNVVVPFNEAEAKAALERLLAQGVEAVAICFLWSFKNAEHERRMKAIVQARAPELFVTASSDLVPKWGEYERTTASVLNAYIGPLTSAYLANIDQSLTGMGYAHPLQITSCAGGAVSVATGIEAPLLTLDSGPVAGVTGSAFLGGLMGHSNIITTDMGGTSFDVGIIHDGEAATSHISTVNQYQYFLPKVDIQTVGAGGGSLAVHDPVTGTLRVGPESAGAKPGPVCYGRGGTQPTVTDADLLLGYFDAENFAGGAMSLDRDGAEKAVADLAGKLGLSTIECAAGIARIVEFNMADLIRRATIEKGHDPRDFVLYAFGGAGPVHAGVFAAELGVERVIVPQKKTASVWCAFGAAAADILHVYEQVEVMESPFDPAAMSKVLAALGERGMAQLQAEGATEPALAFSIDLRHRGQINEVEVPVAGASLTGGDLQPLAEAFYEKYERLYGRGSSFRGAKLEAVTFRVRATAPLPRPVLPRTEAAPPEPPEAARRRPRKVYWSASKDFVETPVFDGEQLLHGHRVAGPAIVETTDTTVVIHPGQSLGVDALGNFDLTLR
ncbi:hydantoinase/oxoprolinase family protein [Marinibaculum pumilum]|uniref:Hydantoinase/oxoprolinase family protein n=1 Tax=Marinibaculum pumilum TaxID=1766165 RepID=A0ABV7L856_9PROT